MTLFPDDDDDDDDGNNPAMKPNIVVLRHKFFICLYCGAAVNHKIISPIPFDN